MFTEKTYALVCHGCGNFHEKQALFLSAPQGVRLEGKEGTQTEWMIPTLGCQSCMAIGKGKTDRSGPIARAFDHGMTPEATATMLAQWPAWREKLEARKGTR